MNTKQMIAIEEFNMNYSPWRYLKSHVTRAEKAPKCQTACSLGGRTGIDDVYNPGHGCTYITQD